MKTESKKQASRFNTRDTFSKKLKTLGWAGALSLLITLNACWPADLNVKKSADKFQQKTEKVDKLKKSLKNKKEDLKELQDDIKNIEGDITNAEREAAEAKQELQKESEKL